MNGYSNCLLPGADFGSPGPPISGTQYPGAIPCGTKMPVNRVLGFAAVLARGVCAGIIESSSGSANVIPAPRRNARLGMCFLVINIVIGSLTQFYRFGVLSITPARS